MDDLDADEDGRVDYVGARLRLNFNGKKAGKEMLAKLGQRLQSLVGGEADLLLKLDPLFRSAVDVGGCYDAVIGTDADEAEIAAQASILLRSPSWTGSGMRAFAK